MFLPVSKPGSHHRLYLSYQTICAQHWDGGLEGFLDGCSQDAHTLVPQPDAPSCGFVGTLVGTLVLVDDRDKPHQYPPHISVPHVIVVVGQTHCKHHESGGSEYKRIHQYCKSFPILPKIIKHFKRFQSIAKHLETFDILTVDWIGTHVGQDVCCIRVEDDSPNSECVANLLLDHVPPNTFKELFENPCEIFRVSFFPSLLSLPCQREICTVDCSMPVRSLLIFKRPLVDQFPANSNKTHYNMFASFEKTSKHCELVTRISKAF